MRGSLADKLVRWESRAQLKVENRPIDVLLGVNGFSDGSLTIGTNVGAEGKLDENTANRCVVVEFLDHRDDLLYSRTLRKGYVIEVDPNLLGGLCFHTNVDGRIGAGSSLDDSQLGLEPGVLRLARSYLLRDVVTDRPEQG